MTTDLLGDPIPPTPAMNAPLPWRVFYVNDMEWWVARTLDELRVAYSEAVGKAAWDECCEDVYELTDAQLDEFSMMETDENETPTGGTRTFRAELEERIACGLREPEYFAGFE